jgi:hypothetical protein
VPSGKASPFVTEFITSHEKSLRGMAGRLWVDEARECRVINP